MEISGKDVTIANTTNPKKKLLILNLWEKCTKVVSTNLAEATRAIIKKINSTNKKKISILN